LLDQQQTEVVRLVAANLGVGESRLSQIFRLDTRTNETGDMVEPRYWRVFASSLTSSGAEPTLITLRFEDVTARTLAKESRRREKALMRSRERLQRLQLLDAIRRSDGSGLGFPRVLMLAGLGLWQINAATGEVECDERCLSVLGKQRVDQVDRDFLLGGSPERVAAHLAVLEAGCPIEYERCLATEGSNRWTLLRGIGVFSDDGKLSAVIGFALDITAGKGHELELSAQADAERSARERSEALARTTDQFIAAVSHELRSPLNAIVSWGELLQLAADPSHVSRAGEAIRRNGRQLAHMVDDLLDSGAIATGKLSVNLEPVDLGALAALVSEDVRKPIEAKGVELRTAQISPCVVMADESRMKQVLWNLLTNALKFTEAGCIEVSVRSVGGVAELSVRDSGRGIAADAAPLIFDRFQQLAPQHSGRIGGLGLGLWLTKHIVTLHGGTISVTSDGAGCGSTFTVRIALAATQPYPQNSDGQDTRY
jgi:signal transduction histidine kinase